MSIFTSDQINRYVLQAEQLFTDEFRCITDRIAIEVVSGTSLYILPDNIVDIRRITYRGVKIDPLSHRDMREYMDGTDSSGKPTNYVFNNVGQMVLKLIPTPAETLGTIQNDLFNPEIVRVQCICEFWTLADGIGYKLPDYIRRRLLKPYVLKSLFLAEGKGQNIKAAAYWDKKWKYLKQLYGIQLENQINEPRRLISTGTYQRQPYLAQPVLPLSMRGVGVNPGE